MIENMTRELKQRAFNDNDIAVKLLHSEPHDFFNPAELLRLARSFRGCALAINFNDTLRNKFDRITWLGVMAPYSWEAQSEYQRVQAANIPTMF